jgi:hypothetical protein
VLLTLATSDFTGEIVGWAARGFTATAVESYATLYHPSPTDSANQANGFDPRTEPPEHNFYALHHRLTMFNDYQWVVWARQWTVERLIHSLYYPEGAAGYGLDKSNYEIIFPQPAAIFDLQKWLGQTLHDELSLVHSNPLNVSQYGYLRRLNATDPRTGTTWNEIGKLKLDFMQKGLELIANQVGPGFAFEDGKGNQK